VTMIIHIEILDLHYYFRRNIRNGLFPNNIIDDHI